MWRAVPHPDKASQWDGSAGKVPTAKPYDLYLISGSQMRNTDSQGYPELNNMWSMACVHTHPHSHSHLTRAWQHTLVIPVREVVGKAKSKEFTMRMVTPGLVSQKPKVEECSERHRHWLLASTNVCTPTYTTQVHNHKIYTLFRERQYSVFSIFIYAAQRLYEKPEFYFNTS